MTYRTIALASAVVSVVYGLVALIVPNVLGSLYGITYDTAAVYAGRLLGGSYVGYAIVNFLTKDTADPVTRRAVAAANAFAWAAGFVVSTFGQLQGLANGIGWTTVVLALAFTVGWAWTYAATRERGPEGQRVPAR